MNEIYLEEYAYPCAAYAVKRSGTTDSLGSVLCLYGVAFEEMDVRPGDIVIWERQEEPKAEEARLTITTGGKIITTPVKLGRHYGVYEGDGLVSDLVFDSGMYFPTIRIRHLDSMPCPRRMIQVP